jgi:hypothetical protein
VNKVFIGLSSDSFPATNQRSFYVPVTRGKEQAVIFTDDKKELLSAVIRPDDPMSATELSESAHEKSKSRDRLKKQLEVVRGLSVFGGRNHTGRDSMSDRGLDHAG